MERKLTSHFFSLIIPVYKQEKTIVKNIKRLRAVMDKIRYHYEIIVVVDGFVDKSFDRLKKAQLSHVKMYGYQENQGKSFAVRLGMNFAKGDYIMFLDAGNEIDPNGISMLLEHMEWYKAHVIVGSKRHPASIVKYAAIRKILSYGYYLFVKVLFGIKVKDTQAGIKIFRKDVLKRILPRLMEKKFTGDLEMLVVALELGYTRIYEAPIKLDYGLGGITSAATMRSIVGIFRDTLAIFYRKNVLQWYSQSHPHFSVPKSIKIIKYHA